jgi:arylsulfatase A-like enzyme
MNPPDILWIVTTQWRGHAIGFTGDGNARTPQLECLACAGVTFLSAMTPHPFGPFARAALLTGIPCPENGVRDYYDPLPLSARTIAHELNELDYATAFFGKWHLASRDQAAPLVGETHARMVVPPEHRGGFEFWEGFEGGFLLNDPWLHGTRLPQPERFSGYQSDVVCGRAGDYLAEQHLPWFAMVSLEAPHPPYGAPAAGVRPSNPEKIALARNVPVGGETESKARRELAGYYAHIEATDRAIGRVVSVLDAAAQRHGRKRPMVVFTSVHGDMHGAHGLFRKGWPHEESVRVPLIIRPAHEVRPPSSRAEPTLVAEPVSLLDLGRATLAWAKGDDSLRADVGSSFSKMTDTTASAVKISMPSVVALPQQCDRVWRGVRTRTRKLVLNDDGSPWLFFDLERDPYELENLALDPRRTDEIAALARLI